MYTSSLPVCRHSVGKDNFIFNSKTGISQTYDIGQLPFTETNTHHRANIWGHSKRSAKDEFGPTIKEPKYIDRLM